MKKQNVKKGYHNISDKVIAFDDTTFIKELSKKKSITPIAAANELYTNKILTMRSLLKQGISLDDACACVGITQEQIIHWLLLHIKKTYS